MAKFNPIEFARQQISSLIQRGQAGAQRVTSPNLPGNVAVKNFFAPQTGTLATAGRNFINNTVLPTPLPVTNAVRSFNTATKPINSGVNTYIQNRYINPVKNIPEAINQLRTPGQRIQGGLGIIGGVGSLFPDPVQDVAMPAYDALKGFRSSNIRGGNFKQNLSAAGQSLTLEKPVGLGEALTATPGIRQNVLNMAEVPLLLYGGLKASKASAARNSRRVFIDNNEKLVDEVLALTRKAEMSYKPTYRVGANKPSLNMKEFKVIEDVAGKMIPEVVKSKEMIAIKQSDPSQWYKLVNTYMQEQVVDAFNPEMNIGLKAKNLRKTEDFPNVGIKPSKGLTPEVKSTTINAKIGDINPSITQELTGKLPGLEVPPSVRATDSTTLLNQPSLKEIPSTNILPDTQKYLGELSKSKAIAKGQAQPTIRTKLSSTFSDIKTKMVDSNAPIEDALSIAEKKYGFSTLPKNDVRLQIDRVLRSRTLASQFAQDNGLVEVIKQAPDLHALDQYMIAKQAGKVNELGIKTGRDLSRDQKLINDLSGTYEPLAKQVNNYSRNLLDYSVKTGLIDQKLATDLIKKYPEYVPLQRVFSEIEQSGGIGTKPVASLSKQTVVKKLVGSEREIESPIESLLLKTQDAFNQGERNIAGKQLASYSKLPGFEGLIKEGDGPHTFSYLDNGVKKTFSTTPEIAAAAKSLDQEQIGLLGKILQGPTRLLQVGATGLNLPFVATNMLKDELTGFVNSKQAAKTSLINPMNFVKSLMSAVKHDDLYDEVVRSAAGGTSFDISRQAPELSVARIRSGKNIGSKIKYLVRNPAELLRAVEDTIGRSEELGRIKNYSGAKQGYLSQGRTTEDATLLAAKNAREATANFARKGDYGRVLNYAIPFFNAGIQGARQLVRSFSSDPVGTSAKISIAIFAPIAATTAWNLSDPKRKEIYQDIPQFEKDNNLIIIPDNATKDARGRWNVIKIPMPPGLSNLGAIERRILEQSNGLDPVRFEEVALNLFSASTSLDISSPNKLASSLTPQAIKPIIEGVTNKNLFTGQEIVPSYMKNKAPEQQVKPYTSGTARKVGGILNTSPLMVENAIRTTTGGLGSQLLNASDTVLNKLGIIPDSQIGGESVGSNIERRFSKTSGGALADKIYTQSDQISSIESQAKDLIKSGEIEKAKALIVKNKDLLIQGSVVKEVRSKVDEYTSMRSKALKDSRLTKEQRDKLITLINQKITELSINYNKIIK